MGSNQHSPKCSTLFPLLSLILPGRIARRIFSNTRRANFCDERYERRGTINILPDDVLLHIFHFDRLGDVDQGWYPSWHRLVHVCRRWRSVVFASPNFLDLKLVCGPWAHTGVWPFLPIVIMSSGLPLPDNYVFDAPIVRPNRVCQIILIDLTSLQLQRLALVMQEQFPALTRLILEVMYDIPPALVLPVRFAPRLQYLSLKSIPFPTLPELLLSATHLVDLTLLNIPHSGYISPEAIVSGLAVLANLRNLHIEFESPLSRPNWESRLPPPPTRTVLPSLTCFEFHGSSEYLEVLVAQIDTPLLNWIVIQFFHQLIFDIPQLALFMRRTPAFETFNDAFMHFTFTRVEAGSSPVTQTFHETFRLTILCEKLNLQLLSLAQVFTLFFPSIDKVEYLTIDGFRECWEDVTENVLWLEIFQQFTAVKHLSVSNLFAKCVARALQKLVGEDILPALESLALEELRSPGPVQEAIGKFVAARELSGHPVAVSDWNRWEPS